VVEDSGRSRREIGRRALPLTGLAPGHSLGIALEPLRDDEIVDGRARLVVCLEDGLVGSEPGVAARSLDLLVAERCTDVCGSATEGVVSAGDLDDDGMGDFVLATAIGTGSVTAHSSADCSILWQVQGWRRDQELGRQIVALGDIDDDGVGDVVVQDDQGIVAISGASGELRWSAVLPSTGPGATAGYVELHALDDATGDGTADLLVLLFPWPGIPLDPWDVVNVVDGGNGERMWSFWGPFLPSETYRVNVGSDWDGDGVRDLVVVGPNVISSVTGETLYDHQTCEPLPTLGLVSQLELHGSSGPVFVGFSGSSAKWINGFEPCPTEPLFSLPPFAPTATLRSFARMGDVDGDGCEDFRYVLSGDGRIASGCSGETLVELTDKLPVSLGDIDGDGKAEYSFAYTSLSPLQGCVRIAWSR